MMNEGRIVYCYYDNLVPCQKGRIQEITQCGWYKVEWLNEENKGVGTSTFPNDRVFATIEECIAYNNAISNEIKDKLKKELVTKEDVLQYMYNSIYSEDYNWSSEKEVLSEK